MSTTKKRFWLAVFMLICLLIVGGCGTTSDPQAATAAGNNPDGVRISTDPADTNQKLPELSLTSNSSLVSQLYATTFALPTMPPDQVCTMERGPHYTLIFLHNQKPVATVLAKREGCQPVTVTGEKQDRQASSTFWSQLDQVVHEAKPTGGK